MTTREMVYEAIWKYWKEYAVPPTVAWLAGECEIASTNTIGHHIKQLVKGGRMLKINRRVVPPEIADAIRKAKAK